MPLYPCSNLVRLCITQAAWPEGGIFPLSASRTGKKGRWGFAAGGLAIVFAILAFGLFASSVAPIYAWLFHLASIALLIVSIAWVEGRKSQKL